jgi:hypothetical protein
MTKLLDRRTFLRGAGGAAIALPFLGAMGCGRSNGDKALGKTMAAGGLFPKRFLVFFSANGTVRENWAPTGSEYDFQLSPILSPLEAHKQNLVILDGVDMVSARFGPGDGHQKGMGHMLTGVELLEGDLFVGGGDVPPTSGWGGGISIDQAIANKIGGTTRFKSLELGVQVGGGTVWSRMSYLGADQPVPPEDDPYAAWDRIFADLSDDPFGAEQLRGKRHAVLDAVMDDYRTLNAKLGAEDKRRLDNHLTAISEVASRLDNGATLGGSCEQPDLGAPINIGANDNYPLVGQLQMDLLVMALACDLTRVGSIQWSRSVSNKVFSWLDPAVPEGHHDLSHEGDSNGAAMDKISRINTWYAGQLGYLIQKLAEIPEGDGTLLDNTCILWCNELGRGNSHTRNDVPWVLAGSAGGAIETGRFLSYSGDTPHNNLMVSLLNAYDDDATNFGNPTYCTGPLSGLL